MNQKTILFLFLAVILNGCKKNNIIENKTLSVDETFVEKQIAQLKLCETIFDSSFFYLNRREESIYARECYLMWMQSDETIRNTSQNHPEASERILAAIKVSRQKALDKKWIEKAKSIYLDLDNQWIARAKSMHDITVEKEAYNLVFSD